MPDSRVPLSGADAAKDGGWSVETALDHMLAIHNAAMHEVLVLLNEKINNVHAVLTERDHRYAERFDAMQQAVNKAEAATERRFDSVNEFRAQLGDQARTLMPRAEAEIRFSGLAERVEKNASEIVAVRANLTTATAERRALSTGSREGWMWAVGAVALVLTVLSIVSVGMLVYSRMHS